MKLFEILFILLLLLPIAILMRVFISKLSKETPKQKRGTRASEEKPSILKWFRERKNTPAEEDEDVPEEWNDGAYTGEEYDENGRAQRQRKAARGQAAHVQDTHGRDTHGRDTHGRDVHGQDVHGQNGQVSASAQESKFVGRSRPELKRTERIPFSEIYGQTGGYPQEVKKPEKELTASERVEARRKNADRKKPARSERQPSKRQKRKNRERSRKRQIDRAKREK